MSIQRPLVDHPYAACYPLISGVLEVSLLESIRQHGLRQPIVLWDDTERQTVWIIDGRNRYRALMEINQELREDQVIWQTYENDEEVRLAVLDYNENRRQMTTAQKSVVAGRILQARDTLHTRINSAEDQLQGNVSEEELEHISQTETLPPDSPTLKEGTEDQSISLGSEEEQKERERIQKEEEKAQKKSKRARNKIRKQVASTLGIGAQTAQKGADVVHRGVPELIHALEQGDLSLEAAYTLTQLEDDEIQTLVSEGKESIRNRVREIKNQNKPEVEEKESLQVDSSQEQLKFSHLPSEEAVVRLTLQINDGEKMNASTIVIEQTHLQDQLFDSLLKLKLLELGDGSETN